MLTQQYLVFQLDQGVFHVVLDAGDQMDAVDEEDFRKLFGYVPLVGIKLSLDFLQKGLVLQWVAVVGVSGGYEVEYLALPSMAL